MTCGRFKQTLKLRIISGAYIPKPAGSSLDDIIDPYVNVYVTGHPADENKLKTAVVKNNGAARRQRTARAGAGVSIWEGRLIRERYQCRQDRNMVLGSLVETF